MSAVAHQLVDQYPKLLRLARSILRDDSEAADAVQSAYGNALRHISEFRGEAAPATWINRIVVNQCLMRLRQVRNSKVMSIDSIQIDRPFEAAFSGSQLPGPHEVFQQREAAAALSRAVERLPASLKKPWLLFEVDELSLEQISKRLRLSIPATKSRLFRARAELRKILAEQLSPPDTLPRAS